jgi:hypothetical protein
LLERLHTKRLPLPLVNHKKNNQMKDIENTYDLFFGLQVNSSVNKFRFSDHTPFGRYGVYMATYETRYIPIRDIA